MNFELPTTVADKIVESLTNNPDRWNMRGDLLFNDGGIIIGNCDFPNALIIHGDGLKFGVTRNTISINNAQKISDAACVLISNIFQNRIKSFSSSIN